MKACHINGFTLQEMIVTLVIASVLLVIAAPNLRVFLQKNHMAAQVNLLLADLHRARSEAIKRRTQVTVCRLDGSSTAPKCASGDGKGWEVGWVVFSDGNDNSVIDADEGEELLSIQKIEAKDLTIYGRSGAGDKIRFPASGLSIALGNNWFFDELVFCDSRIKDFLVDKKDARVIKVFKYGQMRVTSGDQASSNSCGPD